MILGIIVILILLIFLVSLTNNNVSSKELSKSMQELEDRIERLESDK